MNTNSRTGRREFAARSLGTTWLLPLLVLPLADRADGWRMVFTLSALGLTIVPFLFRSLHESPIFEIVDWVPIGSTDAPELAAPQDDDDDDEPEVVIEEKEPEETPAARRRRRRRT